MPNNSDPNKQVQKTTGQTSAAEAGDKNNNLKTAAAPASGKPANESVPIENVKDTSKNVLEQAKDSAGQAYGLVAEKANSTIEEQKSNLSSGLSNVADSIRQVGENLRGNDEQNPVTDLTAKYGDTVAEQIERASTYFEQKDFQQILRDVEGFARRQPTLFIGAAFAAGLLATRFLKSSGSGQAIAPPKTSPLTNHPAADNHPADNPAGQTVGSAS